MLDQIRIAQIPDLIQIHVEYVCRFQRRVAGQSVGDNDVLGICDDSLWEVLGVSDAQERLVVIPVVPQIDYVALVVQTKHTSLRPIVIIFYRHGHTPIIIPSPPTGLQLLQLYYTYPSNAINFSSTFHFPQSVYNGAV